MRAESSVKDEIIHQYHDFRQLPLDKLDEPTLQSWRKGLGWSGTLSALEGWAHSLTSIASSTTGDQFFDFVMKGELPEAVEFSGDRETVSQINACMVRTYRNVNRSFGRSVVRI